MSQPTRPHDPETTIWVAAISMLIIASLMVMSSLGLSIAVAHARTHLAAPR